MGSFVDAWSVCFFGGSMGRVGCVLGYCELSRFVADCKQNVSANLPRWKLDVIRLTLVD